MIKIAKNFKSICPAIFSQCLNCENVQESTNNDNELKFKCKGRDLSSYINAQKCSNQVADQRIRRKIIEITGKKSSSRKRSDSKTVYLSHSRSPCAIKKSNRLKCTSISSTNSKSKEKIKLIKVRRGDNIVEEAIPENDQRHNHLARKTKIQVCSKMQRSTQQQSKLIKEITELKIQLQKLLLETQRLKITRQTNLFFYEETLLKLKTKENQIMQLQAVRMIQIAKFKNDLQEVVQVQRGHQ